MTPWNFKKTVFFCITLLTGIPGFNSVADFASARAAGTAQEPTQNPSGKVLEALKRLPAEQVIKSAALSEKARQVAESLIGEPEYFELVRKFNIQGQVKNLTRLVESDDLDRNYQAEAARLLLESGSIEEMMALLEKTPPQKRSNWAEALGNSGRSEAIQPLSWILSAKDSPSTAVQKSVEGLARFKGGAERLLQLTSAGSLPNSARLKVSSLLNHSNWEDIRTQAASLLPLPPSRDSQPLPPVDELIKQNGNIETGEKVFFRPESLCAICHQIGDRGAALGPALTEIGSKLGKDALYAAILDPNAGVSFGYETTTLTLDTGDLATGIIVSETDQQIELRMAGGITTPYPKDSILEKQTEAISLMPAGLQQTMSQQDLVDLVEFLTSLKSPSDQSSERDP